MPAWARSSESKQSAWRYVAWAAFLILVAYPLSTGPVIWALYKIDPDLTGWPTVAVNNFYQPIDALCAFPEVETIFESYRRLFVDQ